MKQLECMENGCKSDKIKFTDKAVSFTRNKDQVQRNVLHMDAYSVNKKHLHCNLPASGFSAYMNAGLFTKYFGRKYLVSLFNSQL